MASTSQDAKAVFAGAIEKKTPEERAAYLDAACGSDSQLRAEIESLVAAHCEDERFLRVLIEDQEAIEVSPLTESPGTVIDRYKLLEKIGEGGMAVVYMAKQEQPIRRKVALKIIKLGMDTCQVIARFEAERQALAMMDHPNIAKVLDAGATETGRPYFVMELVTGVSITEYCDANNLSTKDRLALFVQVCNAVQHAHQKGIIHRDIKPSNVMVTMRDGVPVPKVIDFGIAKATNQRLTEKTLFTRYAHIIGTPAYMSPEQAGLSDLDVDTRTDIYSLGVLLYELLTGTTPFGEEELRKAGYIEMQRVIREEEPAKPSTRLSTLGETLTDIAKHRNSTPDLLRKAVRGDLDWIVMKSLEKTRDRRYDTASAVAADIERHLDHKLVLARAPKLTYRLRKFLRRHRSRIAVAATLVVLVSVSIVGLSTGYKDRRELARAESQVDAGILSDAHGFFARAEYQKALERVKGILDSPHVGPDARLLYASILIQGRQSEAAVTTLEALRDERPEIASGAYLLLARVLWESESSDQEKLKQVEEYRRTADELFPETAGAYYIQALMAPTIKERLDLLDEALSYVDPRHYESCRLRAFTYYASRRYEEMAEDARVMTVLRPKDSLGYSLQAIAMRELGYYEDAIEYLDAAIERTARAGPERTQLYDQQCETYLRMGEPEQAYDYLLEYLKLSPDSAILQFRLFCAMTARGSYEEADALQRRVTASDHEARVRFRDWSMKYVFDTLGAGLPWHPADSGPEGLPFLPMLDAEEMYLQLSTKARRLITGGFAASWPPDGKKMIFSLGIPGSSGIATFDPTSQEIDLLIAPGKDPAWSPDGRYIAFVRDCQVLPVSELVTAELSSGYRSYRGEEIWIMNADGTAPRRLAEGRWPSWSPDSKHVYYQWVGYGPRRIAIGDGDAESKLVVRYGWDHCCVSPDEKYMAGADIGTLEIKDIETQSLVATWDGPERMWGGNWHPSGHEFSLGGTNHTEDRTGLWIYDLEKGQAEKALSGQVASASWAPDGTEIAISLGAPYYAIWIANLDPNMPTIKGLGPGKTLEEHNQEMVNHYTQMIEADPEDAENYRLRAKYYDYLNKKEETLADIDRYEAVLASSEGTSAQDRWMRDLLIDLLHSVPENPGPPLNSSLSKTGGSLSTDGLSLFFSSRRPGGHGGSDLWISRRDTMEDNWGDAANLGSVVNSRYTDSEPSISSDGLSLYFRSHRPDGFGSGDLWVSTRSSLSSPWSAPTNLGPKVNSPTYDSWPCISADGLRLFFESTRPGGYGHYDIWVTTREVLGNEWSSPVNLGPIVNSTDLDGHPHILPDNLTLFFQSNRPGQYGWLDLWVTTRETTDSPWSKPVNLGPAVNSRYGDAGPVLTPDGSTLVFGSNRPGGYGGWDTWQVSIGASGSSKKDSNLSSLKATGDDGREEVVPRNDQ